MTCRLLCLVSALACSVGCNPEPDFDESFDFTPIPEDDVPKRLALGASYLGTLYTDDEVSMIAVRHPEVVDVERIDSSRVRFVGLGVGKTTITFSANEKSEEFLIEVAP